MTTSREAVVPRAGPGRIGAPVRARSVPSVPVVPVDDAGARERGSSEVSGGSIDRSVAILVVAPDAPACPLEQVPQRDGAGAFGADRTPLAFEG
jgi:hypothetical protein